MGKNYEPTTFPKQQTAQDRYFNEPHDSYVDVTPWFSDPFGSRIRLGTVRYFVPWSLVGAMADNMELWSQHVFFRGYPNSAQDVGIQFHVRVSWADVPQPETLTAQQVAPPLDMSTGQGTGYPQRPETD